MQEKAATSNRKPKLVAWDLSHHEQGLDLKRPAPTLESTAVPILAIVTRLSSRSCCSRWQGLLIEGLAAPPVLNRCHRAWTQRGNGCVEPRGAETSPQFHNI